MQDETHLNLDGLPTLTEVLELGRASAAGVPHPGDTDLVAQVLAALEPRIGALLETRLREALAPALARVADGLIREARAELAPTLRSVVEEAVAQALRQPRAPQ